MQSYLPGVTHKVTVREPMLNQTHEGCCQLRVVANVPCFIHISKDGDPASENDFPLVAGLPEYLTISKGGVKVSVLFVPLSGELYVTEIS